MFQSRLLKLKQRQKEEGCGFRRSSFHGGFSTFPLNLCNQVFFPSFVYLFVCLCETKYFSVAITLLKLPTESILVANSKWSSWFCLLCAGITLYIFIPASVIFFGGGNCINVGDCWNVCLYVCVFVYSQMLVLSKWVNVYFKF